MVTRFNIRALFLGHQYALHKERSKVHNIQLLALCRTAWKWCKYSNMSS